ncbi:beta-ketoacyl synthase N-terminal-like domain-containing protein [Planctomyces sp. SH-PL62]|uniref:beta-ketoacyl synthase N-terminal-like domain-containing protein n=1 Tax=Planctomyces sp. SH-PL62 TaxID=1636152 RepID=UPI00078EC5BD|nr:beta-ketoacyl synthase N-terminal-like domain-containing protein [Planctomyces sp. SH-PL62]AMV37010.1 Phenolphthiocerol synthesis polyketide synthase type I Pks15/1 [Planctomyces sp. SH-PL62]
MNKRRNDGVAIVGFDAAFPGARDPDGFWRLVAEGRDATTEFPPGRWLLDADRAFDPTVGRPDRVYTTRGGFLDDEALEVDCDGLAVDPALVARLDPAFRLALRTAVGAWRSARTDGLDRARVGVVFGHIVLPTATTSALTRATIGRDVEQALGVARMEPEAFEPRNAFPAGAPARLVADALGLGGVAYTLDAACASSLYALKLACDELNSGRADAMLAGGVSRPDALYTQMGFSQLRALSPRGRAAPFDADGDGLIVGEGAGLFVLKRLDDAIRQRDSILGVIRGVGISNDVAGDLLAPSSEGQLRAMRSAYDQAGWSPDEVDLIECHATGTPVGDAVEFESLRALWADLAGASRPAGCVLGSVKSNTGHALTAAGAAGLLKVLLALRNRTKPPTANHRAPSSRIALEGSPFRVLQSAEPWAEPESGRPRRAAISGFGFGGINAHALIEEWTGTGSGSVAPVSPVAPEPVAVVGLSARYGKTPGRDAFQQGVLGGIGPGSSESSKPDGVVDALRLRIGRFRIPPVELEAMLLQQSVLLQVAAEAIADAGGPAESGLRCGVIVGLGLDPNTTNYHLRWWLASRAPTWNVEQGWNLSEADLEAWISDACDAIQPALTANRTMGSLGGLVASRVAREFRIGGPSFSVSSDEGSGLDALRIAADWLDRGELDSAVVGAVDLVADPRTAVAARRLAVAAGLGQGEEEFRSGECAVALVLKRRSDALRDGDRIYAVVGELGGAHEGPTVVIDAPRPALGWTGAAEGLATVAEAILAIDQGIVPPSGRWSADEDEILTRDPSYWVRNREDGPRTARVRIRGLDGAARTLDLQGVEREADPRTRPLGPARLALFPVFGEDPAARRSRLDELAALIAAGPDRPIEDLAASWWAAARASAGSGPALALIAADAASLAEAVAEARDGARPARAVVRSRPASFEVFEPSAAWDGPPQVAFTYPGLGAAYPDMGAELSATWPELARELESRFTTARDQIVPETWWNGRRAVGSEDHRPVILGQISVGALMTSLFLKLGVRPSAAVGYSLGESAALVSLGAWSDRDEMTRRLRESPLFSTELAGPCLGARRLWGLADDEEVDWVAAIVPRSREQVEAAIGDESRVYVLIRNADDEVVIGGRGESVRRVIDALRCPFLPLPTVSTVHCPIGVDAEPAYRALHDLRTSPVADVTFYSGVWGTGYHPDHGTATAAITAQASRQIDYPVVVEKAYEQGARVFVDMGPGSACTRLVGRILKDRPHLAVSADEADGGVLSSVLRALGALIAAGVPVNLDLLYDREAEAPAVSTGASAPEIVVERPDLPNRYPDPPAAARPSASVPEPESEPEIEAQPEFRPVSVCVDPSPVSVFVESSPAPVFAASFASIMPHPIVATPSLTPMTRSHVETQQASADAHEAFLRLSRSYSETMARQVAVALELIGGAEAGSVVVETPVAPPPPPAPVAAAVAPPQRREDVALDREQCMEYAIGSIAAVLGPRFAEVDSYPTRVRLPDEPLMLVDRVVTIEGTQFTLSAARVVTEHDVLHDGWYLDAGRIASCVAIEAGQADLFLSGWLGIDFITKGLSVYRLLDATVTFHSELPGPGDVIRYDIRITDFFRQGETHLFRFEFDGTVDGRPLLTMRGGCAGFFSAEALAAGKGVVPRPLDALPIAGKRPADWRELAPPAACKLDRSQVDALRAGDLAGAFGEPFDRLDLPRPQRLPGGMMTLVHRVEALEPEGGRFGLGLIRAEADVHPDDWFIVCHFVDDRVMPGTLMYECCLHTFRIFLMRMGWVGDADRVRFEPLTGVANRLRCRGQVTETTRVVTYEVTIKELGYGPEPFAIADALMYADGKPIVEITDMALRLAGTGREEIEARWDRVRSTAPALTTGPTLVYEKNQILAFSDGRPSDCFGDRYRPFDEGRFIARLPRPPYQFLDRATVVQGTPWEQVEGTTAEVEYLVPADAWYFEADRQPHVPYGVLIETALQSCGFISAFMGSALLSDEPLKFRNLGGKSRQHRIVDRNSGLLTTTAKVTKINRSAGMIIQHYEMSVRDREGVVFDGETYFGFFRLQALADQVGVREASPYAPTAEERAAFQPFPTPDRAPLPDRRWRMVDRITALSASGGPRGLGFVEGETDVDPSAWFFEAHFLGDPVWPGSLGLESLLQLLKVFAEARWGVDARAVFDSPGIGAEHGWSYRGQITPTSRLVTTQAWITGVDDARRRVTADGLLSVDGKVIYQMTGYTLDARSE